MQSCGGSHVRRATDYLQACYDASAQVGAIPRGFARTVEGLCLTVSPLGTFRRLYMSDSDRVGLSGERSLLQKGCRFRGVHFETYRQQNVSAVGRTCCESLFLCVSDSILSFAKKLGLWWQTRQRIWKGGMAMRGRGGRTLGRDSDQAENLHTLQLVSYV
jgi:hypothetical protein